MAGRGDVLELAASVGSTLTIAATLGPMSERGAAAIARTLNLADEVAPADPVLGRWIREKAYAVLHGGELVIDGHAVDVSAVIGGASDG